MRSLGKKILLVKPDYRAFPIGFGYIASALKRNGIEFDFLDCYFENSPNLERILRSGDYAAVASGGHTGSYTFLKKIFNGVKSVVPAMPCVMGGNITFDVSSERLFSSLAVDYLVIGEGEIAFPELLFAIERKTNIRDVKGIAYRDEYGKVIKTGRREILNLSEYNWMPDWSFFDIKRYGFDEIPVLTGRGCVGRCTFCSPTSRKFRARPLDHILTELESLLAKYSFNRFSFVNEMMSQDATLVRNFCNEYERMGASKPWLCCMRMDIEPDILIPMKKAGCDFVAVGLESGSDRVLKNIKKDLTVEQTRRFITTARRLGFRINASFLTAHYGETAEDIKDTISLAIELKVAGPMAMTINYPGTLNYGMAKKRGLIQDEQEYLESVDKLYGKNYFQMISAHKEGKLDYLNLSSMPNDELFDVIEIQMRRFFTDGFKVENPQINTRDSDGKLGLYGDCPFCSNGMKIFLKTTVPHPFEMRTRCDKCGDGDIYFNPLILDGYRKYFSTMKDIRKKPGKTALVGSLNDVRLFCMYDYFGFDYKSIHGVVAHRDMPEGFALQYPILSLRKVIDINPDTLIVIGPVPDESVKDIVDKKHGWLPDMFYLAPYLRDQYAAAADTVI